VSAVARWLPATGLLAAVAFALTGLVSPPPPLAGAPAALVSRCGRRGDLGFRRVAPWLGLTAAAAAGLQAVAWISFFAPAGILAAGGLPDIVSFAALLAWLVACSLTMLVKGRPSS
jgi:hypothetical protein